MNLAITILKDKLVDLEDYLKVLEAQKQNTEGVERSINQITEALDNLTSSSRVMQESDSERLLEDFRRWCSENWIVDFRDGHIKDYLKSKSSDGV